MAAACRSRVRRTMREFAEQELVIPTGPYQGRRFRVDRQPYVGLWLDEIDSGRWIEHAATGPSQSGKSLMCFVTPILYHLFEEAETVVVGLPDMDMASYKWERDIRPVLERTRYRELLPLSGRGSRGGGFDHITFQNGASLKFMSGGGTDKSRAAYTTRVVCFTEVDELDISHTTSVEATKVKQIEARTMAYGDRRRIYKECTVSTPEGHIWQRYTAGTESRVAIPCPHCHQHVTPERESLKGWEGAKNELHASRDAAFHCPSCGERWTDEERRDANLRAVLLHRGQEIRKGKPTGPIPETNTLGFRWSAVNNLFLSSGFLGAHEWHASRAMDEENAQKESHQFYWAIPYDSPNIDAAKLDFDRTRKKMAKWSRGLVPHQTEYLTVGVDCGKRLVHWCAVAWLQDAAGAHVIDYGREEVPSDDMATEQALLLALRGLRDRCESGWTTHEGEMRSPDQVWIDAGWLGDTVYEFVRESNTDFYRPMIGRGIAQERKRWYTRPRRGGRDIRHLGDNFHIAWQPSSQVNLVEINADAWKSRRHKMLCLAADTPGSMTLFRGTHNEHVSFVKHQIAEHEVDEFVPGRGMVKRWEKVHANNHWGDALYIACAAASFCGFRLFETELQAVEQEMDGLQITNLQRADR